MKNYILAIAILFGASLAQQASAQTTMDSVKTISFKVSNLHCNGDMPTIKKRLLNQDGVDDVVFSDRSADQSTFTVKYHTAGTTRAAIEKAVESTPGCDDQSETPYRVVKDRPRKAKKG